MAEIRDIFKQFREDHRDMHIQMHETIKGLRTAVEAQNGRVRANELAVAGFKGNAKRLAVGAGAITTGVVMALIETIQYLIGMGGSQK